MTNQPIHEPNTKLLGTRPECGAQLRNKPGTSCRQPAGKNTPHEGQGRCWLHGGLTPVKTGRWSLVTRRSIRKILTMMEVDPDPLNILQDLFMVRALLIDFLNRYEENRDAMLAWYASWSGRPWHPQDIEQLKMVLDEYEGRLREAGEWDETAIGDMCARAQAMVASMKESYTGRPREVLDISEAHKMAVEASKMVERIEKIRARGAVSRDDFARVMTELGRTAETALSPTRLRQALSQAGVQTDLIGEAELVKVADELRNGLSDIWMSIRVV